MTEVTNPAQSGTTPLANPLARQVAAATDQPDTSNTVISSDFETFLTLLTTQLENQNPLDPVEATDYAAQLASFANVEQSALSNEFLEQISGQLGVAGLNDIVGWVGQEALVTAPVAYDGAPLTVLTEPEASAANARLVVLDAEGGIVDSVPIPTGGGAFDWTPGAQTQVSGPVSFRVDSFGQDGQKLSEQPSQVYAPVIEAQLVDGAPMLKVQGGELVAATTITALRQPE